LFVDQHSIDRHSRERVQQLKLADHVAVNCLERDWCNVDASSLRIPSGRFFRDQKMERRRQESESGSSGGKKARFAELAER
jgi:Na+-translocating ferredoxin:NAD+ oxidoreductase RnfC subunit